MKDMKSLTPAPDDQPITMTAAERGVWVYLITAVATAGFYASVMVPRALSTPIDQVSWIPLMIWTIAVSIGMTIVGSVAAAIAGAVALSARGHEPDVELGEDERDKEIQRLGNQYTTVVSGVTIFAVLILAMTEADHFWIGHTVYAAGVIGAIIETIAKIRAYRRGF